MKRLFIRGITLPRRLTNHGYLPLAKWEDPPSTHERRRVFLRASLIFLGEESRGIGPPMADRPSSFHAKAGGLLGFLGPPKNLK